MLNITDKCLANHALAALLDGALPNFEAVSSAQPLFALPFNDILVSIPGSARIDCIGVCRAVRRSSRCDTRLFIRAVLPNEEGTAGVAIASILVSLPSTTGDRDVNSCSSYSSIPDHHFAITLDARTCLRLTRIDHTIADNHCIARWHRASVNQVNRDVLDWLGQKQHAKIISLGGGGHEDFGGANLCARALLASANRLVLICRAAVCSAEHNLRVDKASTAQPSITALAISSDHHDDAFPFSRSGGSSVHNAQGARVVVENVLAPVAFLVSPTNGEEKQLPEHLK